MFFFIKKLFNALERSTDIDKRPKSKQTPTFNNL